MVLNISQVAENEKKYQVVLSIPILCRHGQERDHQGWLPVHRAVDQCRPDILGLLLEQPGFNMTANAAISQQGGPNGLAALHLGAVAKGRPTDQLSDRDICMEMLIRAGADPNVLLWLSIA